MLISKSTWSTCRSRFRGHIGQFIKGEQIAAFQRDEGAKILQGARALLDASAVQYTAHTEVGWTAEVIVRLTDSLHCDHIVMGTHGRGAFAELLVGSTTLKVVPPPPAAAVWRVSLQLRRETAPGEQPEASWFSVN